MPFVMTIGFTHLNTSVQPSDLVYYVPTLLVGTFNSVKTFNTGSYDNIVNFGYVLKVDRINNKIRVVYNDQSGTIPPPNDSDFILFSKSKPNNTSSLVGYYASAHFLNNSNERIELFSVASEVSESSK